MNSIVPVQRLSFNSQFSWIFTKKESKVFGYITRGQIMTNMLLQTQWHFFKKELRYFVCLWGTGGGLGGGYRCVCAYVCVHVPEIDTGSLLQSLPILIFETVSHRAWRSQFIKTSWSTSAMSPEHLSCRLLCYVCGIGHWTWDLMANPLLTEPLP